MMVMDADVMAMVMDADADVMVMDAVMEILKDLDTDKIEECNLNRSHSILRRLIHCIKNSYYI
jgi:hypothetical protein